jgi:hypothetical protein
LRDSFEVSPPARLIRQPGGLFAGGLSRGEAGADHTDRGMGLMGRRDASPRGEKIGNIT